MCESFVLQHIVLINQFQPICAFVPKVAWCIVTLYSSLCTGSGWKGLTSAGRVEKELQAESEVADGRMGWELICLPSSLFCRLSSG